MASRSSTTASVSRNVRRAVGSAEPTTARTAGAKAISVAVGIAPAAQITAAAQVDQHVRARGHKDASGGGGDRDRRPSRVTQVTRHELPLELQARDEEEDGQKTVSGPGTKREVQRYRASGPTWGVTQRFLAVSPGEFAHTSAAIAARSSSAPPIVSLRGMSAILAVSGHDPRLNSRGHRPLLEPAAPACWRCAHRNLRDPPRGAPNAGDDSHRELSVRPWARDRGPRAVGPDGQSRPSAGPPQCAEAMPS